MTVIDDALKQVEAPQKAVLLAMRDTIKHVAPDAEEVIAYGIPAFRYKKSFLIGFNAYNDHLSLFPAAGPIAALKDKLASYRTSKGTVQFSAENPIPPQLLTEIVQRRMADIDRQHA